MDEPGSEPVFDSLRDPLRAIGSVVLPSPDSLDDQGWLKAEEIMETALAPRPSGVKRQIRLFLRLVNLLPLFSTGRTLAKLPIEKRAAFLQRIHRSSLPPLRRGLWGIRTLLFMGYYNQDRVREQIGYGADPDGWGAWDGEGTGVRPAEDDEVAGPASGVGPGEGSP